MFMTQAFPLNVNGVRYKNLQDRQSDQQEYLKVFQYKILDNLKADYTDKDGFSTTMFSQDIMEKMINEEVEKDTSFAALSILFVLGYLIYHLKSLVLGLVGISLILFSFSLTAFISQGIFQSTYYGTLHSLIIFIVLGIAADDIFVIVDAWKQSIFVQECEGKVNLRMAYAFRRAARGTAVTSSTTAIAFLANAFSPMMPIKSFGIYAAIIVIVNFFLIILVFPPLLIWYDRKLEGKWCCCSADKEVLPGANQEEPQMGKIDKFFGETWNNMVFKLRWVIVAVFFIWTVIAIIFAA